MNTEQTNTAHAHLDEYNSAALVQAFVQDQQGAALAVLAASAQLAQAVDLALPRLQAGGRLIYVGAGTSGRLGVLDSVELGPTFDWPSERAPALMAGGAGAMYLAVEGAEDDAAQGGADLQALTPSVNDVVLLIAASGATPYVLGALQAARDVGALTIGFSNNRHAPVAEHAHVGVVLDTGAEVISGSTRLKAGTAQKIALNAFSSSVMVRLGKVYGNLMVDLRASNAKLVKRALRLTMLATGAEEAPASAALLASHQRVKTAIVMLKLNMDVTQAEQALAAAQGRVAQACAKP